MLFEMHDNDSAFNDSHIMFSKNSTSEDQIKDDLLEDYINLKYPNVLTNKDAQFDKYGNVNKNFIISGKAELSDYYNYGYKDYERNYFCISIRPRGGTYSDEWYIYASRADFNELFETLKNGSTTVKIIAKMEYADTGLNNMATLVDYFA